MREVEIRQALLERLDEILPGSLFRWIPGGQEGDGEAEFKVKGRSLRMTVEVVGQPNLALLGERCKVLVARARRRRQVPLLVAPFLNPEMRERCKDRGVRYLDLSGNVWIETPAILIEKEAPRNLYPHQAKRRSPFADRASLILRFLLSESRPATLARIGAATGLDSGYVSRIVRSAADLRYATIMSDGQIRLINHEAMLGDWTAVYNWRRNPCSSYFMKEGSESFPDRLRDVLSRSRKSRCALTMHAGNNRVSPFVAYGIWHLYVERPGLGQELAQALRLEPVPEDAGNVIFLTPYYRSSVFFNARTVGGLEVVSDLQLYLDLRHYPVRGVEASEEILARRLRPGWRSS